MSTPSIRDAYPLDRGHDLLAQVANYVTSNIARIRQSGELRDKQSGQNVAVNALEQDRSPHELCHDLENDFQDQCFLSANLWYW